MLTSIAEHPGCTTTELAATTHIAVASASEHTTVLRDAGLISTIRHRNTALHSPTSLGLALLNGHQFGLMMGYGRATANDAIAQQAAASPGNMARHRRLGPAGDGSDRAG